MFEGRRQIFKENIRRYLSGEPFLYVCDNGALKVLIFDRKSFKQVGEFGGRGTNPGEFVGLHDIGIDSKGFLYTAEVTGQRFQKFIPRK